MWHLAIRRNFRAPRQCRRSRPLARACGLLLALLLKPTLYAADTANQSQKPATATVCQTFRVREQDEVWLVSTRHLGCYIPSNQPQFQVFRYDKGMWQPKSEAEFIASDSSDIVTAFYIHGNWVTWNDASSQGLSVYFEMAGKFDTEPPVRFVIWSWPSERTMPPLKDVRKNAARSDYEGYYLAVFLSQMDPEVRVGLLGYSYGARTISGAMHLMGGGQLFGHYLPLAPRPQVRAAVWAAAEHNYWYQPSQFHSHALAAADAWFITVNPCDPVLARYHLLDPCSCPVAVGYAGIYGRNLIPPDVNARVEEVNIANVIGNTHDWRDHLYSLYIQNRTRDYILWHDLGLPVKPQAEALASAK